MSNLINLASQPKETVSNKYKFIDTKNLVENFNADGWTVSKFRGSNQGTGKHMLTLRRPEVAFREVGDAIPEIVIYNSYDASSAYKIMFGIFRLICSNGLVVPNYLGYGERVVHLGNALQLVNQATYKVASQIDKIETLILKLKGTQLEQSQINTLAYSVFRSVFPNAIVSDYTIDTLQRSTRSEDVGCDAWKVLNRMQEKLVRGGIPYQVASTDTNGIVTLKNQTSRAIKAADTLLFRNTEVFEQVLKAA